MLRSDGLATDEDGIAPISNDVTERCPWLELTRWPEYVRGQCFSRLAALVALPDPQTEPVLTSILRLVQAAFTPITTHRINEFDKVRINSFLQRQGVWDRPIQIHLRPSTYRRYRQDWVRMISFVYRTSRAGHHHNHLQHQLTNDQLIALDRMEQNARQVLLQCDKGAEDDDELDRGNAASSPKGKADRVPSTTQRLDDACLELSIKLLDHELRGDIFESAVVGFLAALGVDAANQTYREPSSYTSHLSGLVKISQMLVAQRAVQLADSGDVEHPADALEDMRSRFLMFGVRAPFGWIARLRTFGKRIQNTSTSLGYLIWSDDHQNLSYRDLSLSMDGLRSFIRTQVELAQWDLGRLFLLGEEEAREDVVPNLPLERLVDDPVNNKRGWNFLQDPRNRAILSTTGERWLLDRVLRSGPLRKEFTIIRASESRVIWRVTVAEDYLDIVDIFLQRLLLLVHITGGQPARGTEILSLRYRNTPEGRHRSIFVENGLVSTIPSYHKSQNVTNTTNIIHRYLPQAVSEILIYYLWLIQPFTETLDMLTHERDRRVRSPFLWPQGNGPWDATRLGHILRQQAQIHLHRKLTVLSWRHAAIGISRMHLSCGGFKRDFGADNEVMDQQASHTSWVAGTVYARGLNEAPGVIESRRIRYRAISSEWHSFLGFEGSVSRKRAHYNTDDSRPPKRAREYITIEISDDEN
jgi:hypothetical protein